MTSASISGPAAESPVHRPATDATGSPVHEPVTSRNVTQRARGEAEEGDSALPSVRNGEGIPVVMALLNAELGAEQWRRDSLGKRAEWVVTSCGTLVTLLLGVGTFASETKFAPGPTVLVPLLGAVASFLVAAVCAVRVTAPRNYEHVDNASFEQVLSTEWTTIDAVRAGILVAKATLAMRASANANNNVKAAWLQRAMRAEVAAIALLFLAILAQLLGQLR